LGALLILLRSIGQVIFLIVNTQNYYWISGRISILPLTFCPSFDAFPVKRKSFIASDEFWEKFSDVDITYNMVNPGQVTYTQMFLFYGLTAHSNYWDKHVDAISCLLLVVDKSVTTP